MVRKSLHRLDFLQGTTIAGLRGMPRDELEGRLEALEAAHRRERRRTRVLIVLLLSVGLVAAATSDRGALRARSIEIVDEAGNPAALVRAHEMGGGLFMLFNQGGVPSVAVSGVDGGQLLLRDPTGRDLVELGASRAGDAQVVLRNEQGRMAVQVTTDARGSGYVGVFDGQGIGKTLRPHPSNNMGTRLSLGP